MMLPAIFATVFGVLSALLFYLASPNQKLLKASWPSRRGWAPGALCAGTALAMLLFVQGAAAAVFGLVTLLMTVLTLIPFLAFLRRDGAKAKR